jgi:hypothetical protein
MSDSSPKDMDDDSDETVIQPRYDVAKFMDVLPPLIEDKVHKKRKFANGTFMNISKLQT